MTAWRLTGMLLIIGGGLAIRGHWAESCAVVGAGVLLAATSAVLTLRERMGRR